MVGVVVGGGFGAWGLFTNRVNAAFGHAHHFIALRSGACHPFGSDSMVEHQHTAHCRSGVAVLLDPAYLPCLFLILAQASLRVTLRLKMGLSVVWSAESGVK